MSIGFATWVSFVAMTVLVAISTFGIGLLIYIPLTFWMPLIFGIPSLVVARLGLKGVKDDEKHFGSSIRHLELCRALCNIARGFSIAIISLCWLA